MLLLILVHIVLYVRGIFGILAFVDLYRLPGLPYRAAHLNDMEVIGTICEAIQCAFEVVWTVPINHGDAYQHNHRLHLNPAHIMINPFSGDIYYILQCLYSYCESILTLRKS